MIGRWVRRGTLRLVRVCYGRFSGTRGAHSLVGNQSSVSTFTHLIISLESSSSIERTKKEKQRKRKGHIWHFTTAFFSTEPRPRRIAERRGSEWERERERETERNSQTLISERSAMAASKDRENFVYIAKLAEQAERYEGFKFFLCFLWLWRAHARRCAWFWWFLFIRLLVSTNLSSLISFYIIFSEKKKYFFWSIWCAIYCLLSLWLQVE